MGTTDIAHLKAIAESLDSICTLFCVFLAIYIIRWATHSK